MASTETNMTIYNRPPKGSQLLLDPVCNTRVNFSIVSWIGGELHLNYKLVGENQENSSGRA